MNRISASMADTVIAQLLPGGAKRTFLGWRDAAYTTLSKINPKDVFTLTTEGVKPSNTFLTAIGGHAAKLGEGYMMINARKGVYLSQSAQKNIEKWLKKDNWFQNTFRKIVYQRQKIDDLKGLFHEGTHSFQTELETSTGIPLTVLKSLKKIMPKGLLKKGDVPQIQQWFHKNQIKVTDLLREETKYLRMHSKEADNFQLINYKIVALQEKQAIDISDRLVPSKHDTQGWYRAYWDSFLRSIRQLQKEGGFLTQTKAERNAVLQAIKPAD